MLVGNTTFEDTLSKTTQEIQVMDAHLSLTVSLYRRMTYASWKHDF